MIKSWNYYSTGAQTFHNPLFTIGIPRILNMYEEYPFWHTLFTACGIQVQLSEPSTFSKYETAAQAW